MTDLTPAERLTILRAAYLVDPTLERWEAWAAAKQSLDEGLIVDTDPQA